MREFLDVAEEGERVRDADCEDGRDDGSGDEERDDGARIGTDEGEEDPRNRVAENDAERAHSAKRESELEERDSCSTGLAEARVEDVDVGSSAAHFCVQDDEADRPVCDDAEEDEEEDAGEEACFS